MNLSFLPVQNPVLEDADTITGTVQGKPIIIARTHDDWRMILDVRIDGHLVYRSEPNQFTRHMYDSLVQRAVQSRQTRQDTGSKSAITIATHCGILPV